MDLLGLELEQVIINVLDKLLYNIKHKMIMKIINNNNMDNNNKIQQMVNIMKYNKEIFNNNNKNMEQIDIRNITVQ